VEENYLNHVKLLSFFIVLVVGNGYGKFGVKDTYLLGIGSKRKKVMKL